MHLARELLMNVQCSGGSRNFAKETRALKMRSAVASHLKLTTTIEKIFEADSLTTTGEVAEELNVGHSMSFGILKQIGKVKKLDKQGGASWSDHKFKKNLSFWSVVLSYSMQQQQTISRSDCDMRWKVDFIQQPETTSSVFEWRRRSKALPKAKLAPKKGHGHCLVVFCLSDPL